MTDSSDFPLLDTIDSPVDLRRLAEQDLQPLASELRRFLIDVT